MFCELSDSILDDESPIGGERLSEQTVLGAILRYPRSESIFSRQRYWTESLIPQWGGEVPRCQRKRMGASDYHHSVIRTDDGSVECRPQCLPAYERTHNHFIGQYSALFIWILVGVTNSVILSFLLYQSGFTTDIEWADWWVGLSRERERVLCVVFVRMCSESKGAGSADSQLTGATCAEIVDFAYIRVMLLLQTRLWVNK